jgi:hypothetical protein
VGRSVLGRLFNVLGSTVDSYTENLGESAFERAFFKVSSATYTGHWNESHEALDQNRLSYCNINLGGWCKHICEESIGHSLGASFCRTGHILRVMFSNSMIKGEKSDCQLKPSLVFSNDPIDKSSTLRMNL